jgi:hypothetical protein
MSTGAPEAFIPLNGSAGNSAPVTGGRRHKLKLVTRKQARKLLKKMGRKMRGGDDMPAAVVVDDKTKLGATAGRRHRGTKKTHRRSKRSLFGLKY